MDLVIIIGFGLFLLSAILYTIGWMMNKWEFKPKVIFDRKKYSKRVRLEWKAGLYLEVLFCTVAKHYQIEFTWGW